MTNVKVFVHATDTDADADADTRAMTLAPRTYVRGSLKNVSANQSHGQQSWFSDRPNILTYPYTHSNSPLY